MSPKRDTVDQSVKVRPTLNRAVYDSLAKTLGLATVTAQAEFHGVRRPYWSEIHNCRRSPSFQLAMHVARQLGVSTEALWGQS